MPLSKQYLRYEHAATLGVVHGRKSNLLLAEAARAVGAGKGRRELVVAPTVEDVIVWDPRRGDKAGVFKCHHFFFYFGERSITLKVGVAGINPVIHVIMRYVIDHCGLFARDPGEGSPWQREAGGVSSVPEQGGRAAGSRV